jgi:uncharacterized protein YaaN involved in tellurite resistance
MSGDQNPAAAAVTDGPSAAASGPAVEPPEASTGDRDIRETSNVSNRLLDRPTTSLNATALGRDSLVASGLTELRRTVESLDPSRELAAHIEQLRAPDPALAGVLEQDALFYVRQKHMDILTQLAVCTQGYLALDQIRKNNTELVKGVDRATTTTVAALRTAVIVAQALTPERLVLDQINAVNRTTSNLIESTSVMLRQQTEQVHDQAASSSVELARLQAAFTNIYATMDSIDTFKQRALLSMQTTVDALTTEVGRAQKYLDRTRQVEGTGVAALQGGSSPALLLPGKS